MGYTHYFRTTRGELDEEAFISFAQDCERIFDLAKADGIETQWEHDCALGPQATPELVRFNGVGSDGYETFYLPRETDGDVSVSFCKTAQKPYDVVVVAVLCAAKEHFGGAVEISSDGDYLDRASGRALYQRATGADNVPAWDIDVLAWDIDGEESA